MKARKLVDQIESSSMARLRWLVLKEFGVLPGSKRAGELSDMDCIWCGAQMVLDRREKFGYQGEVGVNKDFDEEKFKALGGKKYEKKRELGQSGA